MYLMKVVAKLQKGRMSVIKGMDGDETWQMADGSSAGNEPEGR